MLKNPYIFYFKQNKKLVSLGLAFLVITNIFDCITPLLLGLALDQITQSSEVMPLARLVFFIFISSLFLTVGRFCWRLFWGRFHQSVGNHLRKSVFSKFTSLSSQFYDSQPIGQMMSLMINDINAFRMAIGPGVLILADAILVFSFVLPIMLYYSITWTLKTLVLMILIPFFTKRVMHLIQTYFRKQQDIFADLTAKVQEMVAGVRVIKSYAQEKNQTLLYNQHSRAFEAACNDVARVDAYFTPLMEFGVAAGGFILIVVGAPEVISGAVSIGAFFAFYQYIQRMVWPMSALGLSLSFFQQGHASFQRIRELLETESDVKDNGSITVDRFEKLSVKDLSFQYVGASQPSLDDISFELEAGKSLAIVGATSSGKSTLIHLLCRLYEYHQGSIQINGHPLPEITLHSLRNLISIVPQEAFLFNETVSENISFGKNLPLSDLERVTHSVDLHEEISSWPKDFQTVLGEKGVNLSGGQRQRLTMARALIQRTPILILDDSLSAVDVKTEKRILAEFRKFVKQASPTYNPAIIVISHRLEAIQWADEILVLKDGKVESSGTHEHLATQSPFYKSVLEIQGIPGAPQ